MTRRRGARLADFLARLLAKRWDEHVPDRPATRGPASSSDHRSTAAGVEDASGAPLQWAGSTPLPAGAPGSDEAGTRSGPDDDLEAPESTSPLTLERVEDVVTEVLGYSVQRYEDDGHVSLMGTWDSFPFVLEIPVGHDGWLLVAGDWEEPASAGMRDELAASVNDWNRDKFFPTVAIVDTPSGPLVRATYLADLAAGVTGEQLRLHVDTALSACTQALSQVRPLLPEL